VPFGVMHLKYLQQWDLACLRSSEGPRACWTCLSFVSRWGQTGTKMNGHWRAAWLKGSGGRGGGGRPWKWQESDGTRKMSGRCRGRERTFQGSAVDCVLADIATQ
jgi:hypothetical protein